MAKKHHGKKTTTYKLRLKGWNEMKGIEPGPD